MVYRERMEQPEPARSSPRESTDDEKSREFYTNLGKQLLSKEISLEDFVKALRNHDKQLETLVTHDGLIPEFLNYRGFSETLEIELAALKRTKGKAVLLALDVDKLKIMNDEMGHLAGDILLQVCAQIIDIYCARGSDIKARIGGDEFGVLLIGADEPGGKIVAERIISETKNAMNNVIEDPEWQSTISIGLTEVKEDDNPETLRNRADQALYEAKEERDKVVVK